MFWLVVLLEGKAPPTGWSPSSFPSLLNKRPPQHDAAVIVFKWHVQGDIIFHVWSAPYLMYGQLLTVSGG